jgi:hypothetical protein
MNTFKIGTQIIPTPQSLQRETLTLDIEKYLWKGIPMVSSINVNDRKFKKVVWEFRAEMLRKKNEQARLEREAFEKIEKNVLTNEHIIFCGKCDMISHWHAFLPDFKHCHGIECHSCGTVNCLPGCDANFKLFQGQDPLYYTE